MTRSSNILAGLTAFFVGAAALHAADSPRKPNTLTPEQIADGWIMLFDGETPFGWKIEGDSKIENGGLVLGGEKETHARTNSEFNGFQLSIEYGGNCKGAQLEVNDQKLDLPPSEHPEADKRWMQGLVVLMAAREKYTLGSFFAQAGTNQPRLNTRNYDGRTRTPITFHVPSGSQLVIRALHLQPRTNVKVIPIDKELSAWNIIPGHPSKFTVNDKGELNIKDGNGEIQTKDQWADFILQLDVFSNGEHLNSGIFFRAIPGEWWQGYEAQIRNEWKGYEGKNPRDEKNEDRSKPVDFGTGGIYGRQAARKVVSNDKEWFTYTVLANGNHIATWVNGYQTADWFDPRRDANSARRGRYLGKGAITLQGHDPTTDLSFRNIRVQELPQKN